MNMGCVLKNMCYFTYPAQSPIMNSGFQSHRTASVLKRFFSPQPVDSRELSIRGIGIREVMPPCAIERPNGTGDYLLMLFHDPAFAGAHPGAEEPGKPDTMMIWPPGKPQHYGNRSNSFSHSWIHCEGGRIRRMLVRAGIPVLKPFQVSPPSCFEQCLLDVHGELVSRMRPDEVIVGNLLENCLREISRALAGTGSGARIPENLMSVRRLIATVPARAITLDEMAARAGMSVPYFCSRFKKMFGLPPMECLIQHRLHRAAHLLSDRNLTVSEIAAQTGYNDLFHFSKMFKKHFGISPRGMRKRRAKI